MMGELKAGEPFGLDPDIVKKINWEQARKRIIHNTRTDFIYAPYLNFICNRAGEQLVKELKSDLSAGAYSPGIPRQ